MKQLKPKWEDKDILKKDVKSCDNHDLGSVKEIDSNFVISQKGGRRYQIPKDSIGTFDGDKVWLRATEAEVLTGLYPFLQDEGNEIGEEDQKRLVSGETIPVPPSTPSAQ
jgi:hypothetical protein